MTLDRPPVVGDAELADLEGRVGRALTTGRTDELDVLGYGEISLVLGWSSGDVPVACKRLPPFSDDEQAAAYGALIVEYLDSLTSRGVKVVPTDWRTTRTPDGQVAGYVVQPVLAAVSLGPRIVAGATSASAATVIEAILRNIDAVVDERVGLDAQLSNWAVLDDELHYFDVTTPLLAGPTGRTRLDLGVLTSPLPAAIRPIVVSAVAPGIISSYHRPRDVMVDLIGNLVKERLDEAVDPAIRAANRHLAEPITRAEIDRWYRSDARTWEVLLRLRRADRWWQQRVRRRVYPFLLPGSIDR